MCGDHSILTSPLIFASCRDCPSYLASPETVRDLLLPAETVVLGKWLPAETVRVIKLPAESLGRKQNHTDSLCRSQFSWTVVSAGSRRSRTVSAEAKYDGQSLQEAKTSGLVYTLWGWSMVSCQCMHYDWRRKRNRVHKTDSLPPQSSILSTIIS